MYSPQPYAQPHELDLDADRLQVAYDLLHKWTGGKEPAIPGGAILVGRKGRVVEPKFFGRQGPEPDAQPLRRDAMFLIASISKPLVYTAAMLLVERGQLNLLDRVTRYLPEFAAHNKGATQVIHLFTHTSGLPDMLDNNEELRRQHAPLETFIRHAIHDTVPLFPPGTSVSYQSMGTLVVAELVQQLTGKPIARFLHDELFAPLGLNSIGLGSQGFDRQRLVRVQTPSFQEPSFGWNSPYWQELGSPWGGVFSTPEDLAAICQMLLDGGRWHDRQLLAPGTVARMTTNRLNDLPEVPALLRRTEPWGLGWRLNHPGTSGSWGDLLGSRVFGHTGATGTMVWMDPDSGAYCILFTNALRAAAPWRLVHLSNAVAASIM